VAEADPEAPVVPTRASLLEQAVEAVQLKAP